MNAERIATILQIALIAGSVAIWAAVIRACVRRRCPLRLDPGPSPEAVQLSLGHVLAVVLILWIVSSLGYGAFDQFAPLVADPGIDEMVRDTVVLVLGECAAVAFMLLYLGLAKPLAGLFPSDPASRRRPLQIPLRAALAYVAVFPLVNYLLLYLGIFLSEKVLHQEVIPIHPAMQLIDSPQATPAVKALVILSAVVLAPLAEELFFRGMVQNYLLAVVRRPWLAIALSAGLFTAVHSPLYHTFPALFLLGGSFGWIYYRYRSLAYPIAFHTLFNAGTFLFYFLTGELQ